MLIQWEGTQPEEATWENLTDLEDKDVVAGGRDYTITIIAIEPGKESEKRTTSSN